MLLLNSADSKNLRGRCYISIHLMLLLNASRQGSQDQLYNFNTSNVTIKHGSYDKIFKVDDNFNTSNVTIKLLSLLSFLYSQIYFNTSNVTIKLFIFSFIIYPQIYFNTSNVTIKP